MGVEQFFSDICSTLAVKAKVTLKAIGMCGVGTCWQLAMGEEAVRPWSLVYGH